MHYRLFILLISSLILANCSLLDRVGFGDKEQDVAELEPIPTEESLQEPSILIDDEEMMPGPEDYIDDNSIARTEQMSSDPSGTFVGQKIGPLRSDFDAVMEAFNAHRDSYEEIKSRIAPPNGLVFNIPINDVYDMTDRYEIIDLILNEVNKFNNDNNCVKLGERR